MNLQGSDLGRRITIWSILLCFFWSWNSAAQSQPYFLPLFSASPAPLQISALGAQGSEFQSLGFGAQTQGSVFGKPAWLKNWSLTVQGSLLAEADSSLQWEFSRFGVQFTSTPPRRGSSSWQIQTWAKLPGLVGDESTDLGLDVLYTLYPWDSQTRITGSVGGITRSLDYGSTLRWRIEASRTLFDQILEATASLEGSTPEPHWIYGSVQTVFHFSPSFSGFIQGATALTSDPSSELSSGGWVMLGFHWSLNSIAPPSTARKRLDPKTEWPIEDVQQELHLIKIDYGTNDQVFEGQSFDVYLPQENQEHQRIARARVEAVKSSEAILAVVEYFQDQRIEREFVVKPSYLNE